MGGFGVAGFAPMRQWGTMSINGANLINQIKSDQPVEGRPTKSATSLIGAPAGSGIAGEPRFSTKSLRPALGS